MIILIHLIIFLALSYALLILATTHSPYESNEVKFSIQGLCVDCESTVPLTQQGQCAYCLSNSIIKREPKKLVQSEIQKVMRRIKR